jgi:UDP-N-acetylglucosamine 3-dehydrogenase
MLASARLDAVIVAVPASLHVEVSLDAIAAGCAVLVEKPLAPTYAEALRIVKAALDAGVSLMPGHIERFNPAHVELARRVRAGDIGRVLQLTARRMSAARAGEHGSRLPPSDVNVVHDSAIHDIDAIRYVLGLEVESVYGASQSGLVTPAEDAINATLRFKPSGAGEAHPALESHPLRGGNSSPTPIASLEVNWLSPRRVRDLSVLGEHGTYVLDYASQSLILYRAPGEPAIEIPVTRHDQLEAELTAFVSAVRDGAPMPVSAEDGLAAVAIADALTKSARTGKIVALPESAP